jgi:putative copper resistance protein D
MTAVRAIHFAATIAAVGLVFFRFFVAEPAFSTASDELAPAAERLRSRWSWMVWISLVVAVASAAAWLVLLASDIYGVPIIEVCRHGGILTVVTDTRFGQVCSIRLGLAILLALSLAVPTIAATRARSSFVPIILAIGLLTSLAWIGHAGATPGLAGQFHLAADALHLMAVGAWIGGLPPLAMLLACARRSNEPGWTSVAAAAIRRFSLLGVVSVGVLLATGIVNTWYLLGTVGNLIETDYGRLILLKIGLFAAMVGIAAVNRFHLTPRLAAVGAMRRLSRNSLAETALGLAALLLVGALGTMQPAAHEHNHAPDAAVPADAAFVHIHSERGMAEVTILPGRAGTTHATIRLLTEELNTLAAQQVTITLTGPAASSTPTSRIASPVGDGTWKVDAIELSESGIWTLEVGILLDTADRLVLTGRIVIRP